MTLIPSPQSYLPNPLIARTAVTTYQQFAVPEFNTPPDQWPLTDPSTVSLTVTAPDGSSNTYTYGGGYITKISTGLYSAEIDTSGAAGTWTIEWTGTGNCAALWRSGFVTVA